MATDGTDQRPLAALPGTQESPDWQTLPVTPPADAVVPSPSNTTLPARPSAPKVALKLAAGQSLRTVRRKGLVVRVRCSPACTLDVRLLLGQSTVKRLHLAARVGTRKVTIRLTKRARARLASVKRAQLTLRVSASAGGGQRSVQRRVILTRTRATLSGAAR